MRVGAFALFFSLAVFPAAIAGQIVDTTHSKFALLHPVPVSAVKLPPDSFWGQRRQVTLEKSMPTMFEEFEKHGTLDNFRRLQGKPAIPRQGPLYTDSDIYKWLEAAAYFLTGEDHPELREQVDGAIEVIGATQEPSGYLNTYYVEDREKLRFTEMYRSHELYCLGHLLQAGIALERANGNAKLLAIGRKYADYVLATFGPDRKPASTGHPELEMALVELTRQTGDRRYLDFAGYLLSGVETQRLHLRKEQTDYTFSGIPFTSRTEFVGHAVRAMYAACGATDYYAETGDAKYLQTLDRLWDDEVAHKLYITGGVGSRSDGEAFGEPFELPNAQAYTESCAAIGNYMWNWRMLAIQGQSKYADLMERALYNGINSGMSLDGTLYCYRNPLESNGEKIRNEFYTTDCCPPNIERTMGALPGYFYSTGALGVYVNLYGASTLDWHLENGAALSVTQATTYPWTGAIDLTVNPSKPGEFSLFLRIPAWSKNTVLSVNGISQTAQPGQYAAIHRTWKSGDRVRLELDMSPRLTQANALVRENSGRVALERGPVVYCLEKSDQPLESDLFDDSLLLTGQPAFTSTLRPDLLGGIVTVQGLGVASNKPLAADPLYRDLSFAQPKSGKQVTLTFVPYYSWANRGQQEMEVWVPVVNDTPRASR